MSLSLPFACKLSVSRSKLFIQYADGLKLPVSNFTWGSTIANISRLCQLGDGLDLKHDGTTGRFRRNGIANARSQQCPTDG